MGARPLMPVVAEPLRRQRVRPMANGVVVAHDCGASICGENSIGRSNTTIFRGGRTGQATWVVARHGLCATRLVSALPPRRPGQYLADPHAKERCESQTRKKLGPVRVEPVGGEGQQACQPDQARQHDQIPAADPLSAFQRLCKAIQAMHHSGAKECSRGTDQGRRIHPEPFNRSLRCSSRRWPPVTSA